MFLSESWQKMVDKQPPITSLSKVIEQNRRRAVTLAGR
jgi:hypothetical protein